MNFDEYSAEAERVWLSDKGRMLVDAIGLCAEAGEAGDHFKKAVGHGKPLEPLAVAAELGDTLWYLDRLAARAGYTLAEIAVMNVAKLRTRYPDGFQAEYRPKDEKKERVAMAIAVRNYRAGWGPGADLDEDGADCRNYAPVPVEDPEVARWFAVGPQGAD